MTNNFNSPLNPYHIGHFVSCHLPFVNFILDKNNSRLKAFFFQKGLAKINEILRLNLITNVRESHWGVLQNEEQHIADDIMRVRRHN